jgi:hypothetical protein
MGYSHFFTSKNVETEQQQQQKPSIGFHPA